MKIDRLQQQVYRELVGNILPFWLKTACDDDFGGYVGEMNAQGIISPKADKSIIAHARILWSFSSAYSRLNDAQYLKHATRAYKFIVKSFIDNQYFGAFYSLSFDGKVIDDKKNIVAQAYVIYGLSAYYKATQEQAALTLAQSIFNAIEKNSLEKLSGGYIEELNRQWQSSDASENYRMTQVHLHLIEAYSELFDCEANEQVKGALTNLVSLFIDRFIDFDALQISQQFSSNWQRINNTHFYGHDLEASWLIVNAAEKLNSQVLISKTSTIALALIKRVINDHGSSKKAPQNGVMLGTNVGLEQGSQRHGWVQAEALMAFAWAFETTGNELFKRWLQGTWHYIINFIKDNEHGDWYSGRNDDGSLIDGQLKIGPWKCPYHSVRACLRYYFLLDKKDLFETEKHAINSTNKKKKEAK